MPSSVIAMHTMCRHDTAVCCYLRVGPTQPALLFLVCYADRIHPAVFHVSRRHEMRPAWLVTGSEPGGLFSVPDRSCIVPEDDASAQIASPRVVTTRTQGLHGLFSALGPNAQFSALYAGQSILTCRFGLPDYPVLCRHDT